MKLPRAILKELTPAALLEKRKRKLHVKVFRLARSTTISVRACSNKSGCGEPNILNVTTTPGRKFDYFLNRSYYACDTAFSIACANRSNLSLGCINCNKAGYHSLSTGTL